MNPAVGSHLNTLNLNHFTIITGHLPEPRELVQNQECTLQFLLTRSRMLSMLKILNRQNHEKRCIKIELDELLVN